MGIREGDAPVYYVLVYPTLGYVLTSYWLMRLRSGDMPSSISSSPQSHFFSHKYDSPLREFWPRSSGCSPWFRSWMLQLKGLGIIRGGGILWRGLADPRDLIGAAVVALYVIISGVRGSTWNAVFKDFLILFIVVFLGDLSARALPRQHRPEGCSARSTRRNRISWCFPETGMNIALVPVDGASDSPRIPHVAEHVRSGIRTAKDDNVFRRNAVARCPCIS